MLFKSLNKDQVVKSYQNPGTFWPDSSRGDIFSTIQGKREMRGDPGQPKGQTIGARKKGPEKIGRIAALLEGDFVIY